MTPEHWQRIKPVFYEALELHGQERERFLREACGDDAQLELELKELLRAQESTTIPAERAFVQRGALTDRPQTRFKDNEIVLERFRIVRLLGRGGMGEVYEADDLQLGKIALKTVKLNLAASPELFEQFRKEVLLARKATGPHVCRIHELHLLPAVEDHQPTAFLTMEYLDGTTLFEKNRREGALPWSESLEIVTQICEGLRLLHRNGIIHRDLKSGNIMLCQDQAQLRVVLMDFGLARQLSGETQEEISARNRLLAGTPEYMAPEQFEGESISPATDIYALGVIFYELLTGVHPYAASSPVATAVRRARRIELPSEIRSRLPMRCSRILAKCLAYEKEDRYQKAEEVVAALHESPATLAGVRHDRPWILAIAVIAVAAVAALAASSWWKTRHYDRPTAEVSRWYDLGVAALREGNYVKASRSLQQAIDRDNTFTMAHARLAEVWANLDFDGSAQKELLIALPAGGRLPPLDRMYLSAIHATITRDTATQVALYRKILDQLPQQQKAAGYVDVGMAYERSGDTQRALENYRKAATLDGTNPAPLMRTAVLESRLHHVDQANRSFDRAEVLFRTEMNEEGLAELDYARGYAANDGGGPKNATVFLLRSLERAKAIPSIPLQIRVLTQLSSAASRSDAEDQAATYAIEAIDLARRNQIDGWAATGLVRLATVKIHQHKFDEAEPLVREALQVSHQTQQLRVEALANGTLASLMNQMEESDKVVEPATAALRFYTKNGFFVPAQNMSLLLIRAQRDRGEYSQALASGTDFLEMANRSHIQEIIVQAEDVVGSVYLQMEEYPKAPASFTRAEAAATSSRGRAYESLHSAEMLWKLGRYAESDEKLRMKPVDERFSLWISEMRIASDISRGLYAKGFSNARTLLERTKSLPLDDRREIESYAAVASSHLRGDSSWLVRWRQHVDERGADEDSLAKDRLLAAESELYANFAAQAFDDSVKAATYFSAKGKLDSWLRAEATVLQSAKRLRNPQEFQRHSVKVVDIVSRIQQTWGATNSESYLSRPDLKKLTQAEY